MITDNLGNPIFKGSWVCWRDFYRGFCYGKVRDCQVLGNEDWIEIFPCFQIDQHEPDVNPHEERAKSCLIIYGPNDSR